MNKAILSRVEALEAGAAAKAIPVPIFSCIIDGEEKELTALDFAFSLLEGHKGSFGGQCGVRYEEWEPDNRPLSEKVDELQAAFAEMQEQYNSPEEVAKRKAEYEELQRIGELRRMDCLCGRDMDKCHPLPWQRKEGEEYEAHF